jgi:hypothetical protein
MNQPLDIVTVGRTAWQCLSIGHGRVLAQFQSSLYLQASDNGPVACLLPLGSEPGPLHAELSGPFPHPVLLPEPGLPWRVDGPILRAGRMSLDLRNPKPWTAPDTQSGVPLENDVPWAADAPPDTLLAVLLGDVQRLGHADWRQPALHGVLRLSRWLKAEGRLPSLAPMIGLGPGLTPSADDVLGALLITLHARGETDYHLALANAVRPLLGATHPISAAHLEAAIDGEGCEALHLAVGSLVSGQPPTARVFERLTALGAQSGWDMLAGILVGTRAVGHVPAGQQMSLADGPLPQQ